MSPDAWQAHQFVSCHEDGFQLTQGVWPAAEAKSARWHIKLGVSVHSQFSIFDPRGCGVRDVFHQVHVDAGCPQIEKQAGAWDTEAGLYEVQDRGLVVILHCVLGVERHPDAISLCDTCCESCCSK